jgi:hypothetical protein
MQLSVTGRPTMVKVYVYDYNADLVGSAVARITKQRVERSKTPVASPACWTCRRSASTTQKTGRRPILSTFCGR